MITGINKTKTLVKHISCVFKCKFSSSTWHSNEKWNNDKCQSKCKKYRTHKKDLSWNTSACIYENSRYLKSIVDNSVIVCDEIMNVIDSVWRNVTNTNQQILQVLFQ